MSRFLNPQYASLEAYTPGEQPTDMSYIKLNTNESPFPPAPAVLAAANKREAELLRLYPDPDCGILRKKIAERYGVTPENVFLSNGSDDILNFAFMAFAGGQTEAVFPDISYGFYSVYADLHGVKYTRIPLRQDFSIDPTDYCGTERFTVIANPNAPTGIALSLEQVEEIIRTNPERVVLIDEAYVDFGGTSCAELTKKYENLLVVMTFSKSRSLAGARLGFAIGNHALIDDLNRIKFSTNPYSVNRLSLAIGAAAIDSAEYYQKCCAKIAETRDKTSEALRTFGFRVLPSCTNFLLIQKDGLDGEIFYQKLKKHGILVRHFTTPRITQYNRVTIGTEKQMHAFLTAVLSILDEQEGVE